MMRNLMLVLCLIGTVFALYIAFTTKKMVNGYVVAKENKALFIANKEGTIRIIVPDSIYQKYDVGENVLIPY